MHCLAPDACSLRIPRHTAKTPDPFTLERLFATLAPIGCHRIRLAIDQVSISTDQVPDAVQHCFGCSHLLAKFHSVLNQSRFQLCRQMVVLIRIQLARRRRDQLFIGIKLQKHRIGGFIQFSMIKQCPFVLIISRIKLMIDRFFVITRSSNHPRIACRFGDRDLHLLLDGFPPVVGRGHDGEDPTVLSTQKSQFARCGLTSDRQVGNVPLVFDLMGGCRFQLIGIRDLGDDFEGSSTIPIGGCLEAKFRICNGFPDHNRNIAGFDLIGINRLEPQCRQLIPGNTSGIHGHLKTVGRNQGLFPISFQGPIDLLRSPRPSGHVDTFPFDHRNLLGCDRKNLSFLYEVTS